MKKFMASTIALVFVISLVGCGNSEHIESENNSTLIGVVEEIHDSSMVIRCKQAAGYPQGELFSVSLNTEATSNIPEFLIGDQIIVYYNGDVAESDPLQINTVFSITTIRGADIDTSDSNVITQTENANTNLDTAIASAIMQYNYTDLPDDVINVESHIILANERVSGTPLVGEVNHVEQITVYLVYLYARYFSSLEEHSSTANSAAITFTVDENGEFLLQEYWEARPGSYYSEDVNSKFPAEAAKEALLGDGYSEKLIADCHSKATVIANPLV